MVTLASTVVLADLAQKVELRVNKRKGAFIKNCRASISRLLTIILNYTMNEGYTVGDRLKELRQRRGLTQLALAERLSVSKTLISAYENAISFPSYDVLLGISNIFNVSTDYLLGKEKGISINMKGLTDAQIGLVSALVSEFQKVNKS